MLPYSGNAHNEDSLSHTFQGGPLSTEQELGLRSLEVKGRG